MTCPAFSSNQTEALYENELCFNVSTVCVFLSKVDSLIEAFGTNKQKKALSSRRLNQVGGDTLHQAVAQAAHTVINDKGLEGKCSRGIGSW